MGTHPISESDFDCLTECHRRKSKKRREARDEKILVDTTETERVKSSKRLQPDVESESEPSRKKKKHKSKVLASSLPDESGDNSDRDEQKIVLKKKKKKKNKERKSAAE